MNYKEFVEYCVDSNVMTGKDKVPSKSTYRSYKKKLSQHTEDKDYKSRDEIYQDLESYSSTFVIESVLIQMLVRWLINKLATYLWNRIWNKLNKNPENNGPDDYLICR